MDFNKYRYRYEMHPHYRKAGEWQHLFILIGAAHAIHFHFVDRGEEWDLDCFEERVGSAGIEIHRRSGDGPPDHDYCSVLRAPCWHDGTSLGGKRVLELFFEPNPVGRLDVDHEAIFRHLTTWHSEDQPNTVCEALAAAKEDAST